MRISFLHYSYPGIGGTETVTNLLARSFTECGHHILILAWRRPENAMYGSDYETTYLPDQSNLNSAKNAAFIYDFLISNHIDCLINQGPFWIPTQKVKQSKTVILSVLHYAPDYKIVNQQNAIVEKFREKSPSFAHFIKSTVRYCFKKHYAIRDFDRIFKSDLHNTIVNSDRFVLLCNGYINQMEQLMRRSYDNLIAIGNGLKMCNEIFGKSKTIVCIGRLTKWDKRVDRLLKIWQRIENCPPHADWNLQILGDGPERKSLEELSRKLGLKRCEFLGFVDVKPYLSSASILAMTSSSEGFPMVILEAGTYGVVPIAFDVSEGIRSLIDNGVSGVLIQSFDSNEYAIRLAELMTDNEKRQTMANHARERTKAFDVSLIANKWIELINKIKHEKTQSLNNYSSIQ